MKYILIGKMIKAFGLKGEMKLDLYTDFAKERFKKGSIVYFKLKNEYKAFECATFRMHKGQALVSFKDYQDINLIEMYRDTEIYKDEEDIKPLAKGQYYFRDLVGLDIYDSNNNLLGKCLNVEEGVSSNYLRLQKLDKKEVLIPYLPVFIKEVSLEDRRIVIEVMEGLL